MSPLVCAHRGLSHEYPENTLLAIEKAIEIGVDFIEIDVHKTKDGKIVLSHDANLKRVAGKEGAIRELTYDELLAYDLPMGQKVPLLSQVLDLIVQSKTKLNIEVKAFEAEEKILEVVKSAGAKEEVQYSSFLLPVLMEIQDLDSSATLCPLIGSVYKMLVPDLLNQVKMVDASYLNIEYKKITKELVDGIHDAKIGVQAWTPDSRKDLTRMIDIGVDIIITNEPKRLMKILDGT